MKMSSRYVKIVEWSDEDQCYVGSCPGLFYGGCHGDNELTLRSSSLSRGLSKTVDPRYGGETENFLENCVTSVTNKKCFQNCARSSKRQLNYTVRTAGPYLRQHPVRTMPTRC